MAEQGEGWRARPVEWKRVWKLRQSRELGQSRWIREAGQNKQSRWTGRCWYIMRPPQKSNHLQGTADEAEDHHDEAGR